MLIDTLEKFNEVKCDILMCNNPSVDTETSGTNPFGTVQRDGDRVIGIAIDIEREAYYFPFRHMQGNNLPMECMDFLRPYLSNHERTFIGFNYKFDEHMMAMDGVEYAKNYEDVMLGLHLLNENEPNFQLKDTCDRYEIGDGSLQESVLKDKVIAECKKLGVKCSIDKKSKDYWKGKMIVLPPEDVEPYACDDVRLTRGLHKIVVEALKHYGLYDIWKQANFYSYITSQMERNGIGLDVDLVKKYQEEATIHKQDALDRLQKSAGYMLNPNSSKQVCAYLGTESSAAEILDDLIAFGTEEEQEKAKLIHEARGWASVDSRYYTPYLEAMDKDGNLHCNLNLIGTISGRLSCNNPNLQAVARKTDVFKVKDVLVPRPGYTLVESDYAQAEMRLACFYGKVEAMAKLIEAGEDIHGKTAEALDIPRSAAKRINFGVIYGIGADALARQLRIEKKLAKEYLNKYHSLYPEFRKLLYASEALAERQGFIQLWTGRQRHFNCPKAETHKAMSNLIQGGVSEIMRVTISKLYPAVTDIGGRLLLQVHDSIISEIPDNKVDVGLPIIKGIMEDLPFKPRMTVDIKYGKSWGQAKHWEVQ